MFSKLVLFAASLYCCESIATDARAFTITDPNGTKVESQSPYELQGIYFFDPSYPSGELPFEHENVGSYVEYYKQDVGQTSIDLTPAVYAESRRFSDQVSVGSFTELSYQIYVASTSPSLGGKKPIDLNIIAHGTTYAYDSGAARIGLEIEPTASLAYGEPSYFDGSNSVVYAVGDEKSKSKDIALNGTFKGFYSDTLYTVTLLAEASCLTSSNCVSRAQLDPQIMLTSDEAADYSLLFADGIENRVSIVPLPSSAPLLSLALVGLGLFSHMARRTTKAAV